MEMVEFRPAQTPWRVSVLVHGHDRRGDRGGGWMNVSLVRVDSVPADVPQAFFNKIGLLRGKSNKETLTGVKILSDNRMAEILILKNGTVTNHRGILAFGGETWLKPKRTAFTLKDFYF
jgi:hypothetical protein